MIPPIEVLRFAPTSIEDASGREIVGIAVCAIDGVLLRPIVVDRDQHDVFSVASLATIEVGGSMWLDVRERDDLPMFEALPSDVRRAIANAVVDCAEAAP